MNIRTIIISVVIGIVLGALGAVFLPKYVRPYLPEAIIGKRTVVSGTVMAKERTGSTLLLTVNTAQGALLATLTKKREEVDLLVGAHDTIEFTLDRYRPFIDDPKITRVVKAPQAALPGPEKAAAVVPADKGVKEAKPKPKRQSGSAPIVSAPAVTAGAGPGTP